ncbi:pteridine reductase [Candidatus Parabeggiatoa sp. HSG14]|uniref:pteridine reductase n=1 Tax=Candidatus Parabeggiatoa sp. HSG14 TaxID=3055593 RepID=UPI0025A7AAEB|nr:pteridine reductase [Thiotrichales bacterium HSG14]
MHAIYSDSPIKESRKEPRKEDSNLANKVALITGGVKRIGAAIARQLHAQGINLVLHYHHSETAAHALQAELHNQRPNSVLLFQADLRQIPKLTSMVRQIMEHYKRLDIVVNNASAFYPTPLGKVDEKDWEDLLDTNLKAPFFLSQAVAPHLSENHGCIINLVDIHADRPMKSHPVYNITKAGLVMLTKTLARELGPKKVRVNAIAPGAILWPDKDMDEVSKQRIVSNIALKCHGDPKDIAKAVLFLVRDGGYITGQVITVDGGRTLNQ